LTQLIEGSIENGSARIENNNPACRKGRKLAPHRFPEPTPNTISLNRLAQRARQCKAKAGCVCGFTALQAESNKEAAGNTHPALVNLTKLSRPDNSFCLRK
jgi:hypothetical protein